MKLLIDANKLNFIGPNFPTYISSNSNTTPDLILCNKKVYHNFTIEKGPVTTSDHLPVILKLTTNAIREIIPPKFNFKKADWDKFNDKIKESIEPIDHNLEITTAEVDRLLEEWYVNILNTMTETIPKTKHKTIQTPILNNTIKNYQFYIENLTNEARLKGWTIGKYNTYKILKQKLIKECKNQFNANWEKKIELTKDLYKSPKDFWNEIKKLRGNTKDNTPYIIDNNIKLYSEEEKEIVFRRIWEDIFRINPEENIHFDINNEISVNNFLNENLELFKPYNHSD